MNEPNITSGSAAALTLSARMASLYVEGTLSWLLRIGFKQIDKTAIVANLFLGFATWFELKLGFGVKVEVKVEGVSGKYSP